MSLSHTPAVNDAFTLVDDNGVAALVAVSIRRAGEGRRLFRLPASAP